MKRVTCSVSKALDPVMQVIIILCFLGDWFPSFISPLLRVHFSLSNDWTVVALPAHTGSPPPPPQQMLQRRLYEELIWIVPQSSEESVILPSILPSAFSAVHSKMKRSQHCIVPLALCKYYMFSLDVLVSITSTLWLHYFRNAQLCRWLRGMT